MDYILDKYNANIEHAKQVQKLSLLIFDKLKEIGLHDMSAKKRRMLEIASLLHDIGYSIDSKGHNKHSATLIRQEHFEGMDEKDKQIIGCIARYHRGNLPLKRHNSYSELDKKSQRTICKLGGIVRLADGLDRAHLNLVEDIDFKYVQKYNILWTKLISRISKFHLDLSVAFKKKELFENAFGVQFIMLNVEPLQSSN